MVTIELTMETIINVATEFELMVFDMDYNVNLSHQAIGVIWFNFIHNNTYSRCIIYLNFN